MKNYTTDSAEAMARVLAMTMITDARLDDTELEIMDHLFLYDVLGISRDDFSRVVGDYCEDLLEGGAPDGKIALMDEKRIDAVIGCVKDPQKRLVTARMIANIIKADGKLHDAELALFRHILERWDLTLDQLKGLVHPA
ncbi:MAG: hypothetical protein GC151_11955 [Betaproteobacteria bacterium]|nr:hypothetical protein [Betaproteobacteria bacterium]